MAERQTDSLREYIDWKYGGAAVNDIPGYPDFLNDTILQQHYNSDSLLKLNSKMGNWVLNFAIKHNIDVEEIREYQRLGRDMFARIIGLEYMAEQHEATKQM